MAIRGFRTKIALHVLLLVLLSALFTVVLATLALQGLLVRSHLNQHRLVLQSTARVVLDRHRFPFDGTAREEGAAAAADVLEQAQWTAALILGPDGGQLYACCSGEYLAALQTAAAAALNGGDTLQEPMGTTWAVYFWQPQAFLMAVPVLEGRRTVGSMAAIVLMTPLHEKLRQYNKPILIFVVFNTLLLSFVGFYRIFRIYLRPIDRIVRQADGYGAEEDLFFSFRQEDNELNRLSSALNRMLKRISEDRHKLQQSVASLEMANTELKRAQNEIVRGEKMASVGRLAAGIAHEIGNPLGIVLGYLDLLKQPDLDKPEHDDYARRSEDEIQRISTIIRQLLDLARPRENAFQIVSVHEVIADIERLAAHQPLLAGIRLLTELNAAHDRTWGNPDQLRQVFLNLLLNAADAIRGAGRGREGRIRIGTSCACGQPTGDLVIEFEDNGEGIAADRIETIFDPFYTTKEPGKGTGLGLSVSYMLIEKMGGTLSVQSMHGQGTTFILRLPLSPREPAGAGGPHHLPSRDGHYER